MAPNYDNLEKALREIEPEVIVANPTNQQFKTITKYLNTQTRGTIMRKATGIQP